MAYGYELLLPSSASKILRKAQPKLLQEGGLYWLPKTKINKADSDEMTLQYTDEIYASDVISEDATALVRESGQFYASSHGTNKLKHGKRLTEKQILMLYKIKNGKFVGDNEIINFENWVKKSYKDLLTGHNMRVEALLSSMFRGGYDYDRLGLRASGVYKIHNDFKATPSVDHDKPNAKPLKDVVAHLNYLSRTWGRRFTTITCREQWIQAVVNSDEYKNELKLILTPYRDISDVIELRTTNYMRHATNISAILTQMLGWNVTVEVNEEVYKEYRNDGKRSTPQKYHPEEFLYYSGIKGAFDVGNGPLVEAMLGEINRGNIIGTFKGVGHYGPMGYTSLGSPDLNPPGINIWVTGWNAPRLFDDMGIGNMQWKS